MGVLEKDRVREHTFFREEKRYSVAVKFLGFDIAIIGEFFLQIVFLLLR